MNAARWRPNGAGYGNVLRVAIPILALAALCLQIAQAADDRVFELRKYITHEGKLDDLHKRFSEHTNKLFVKHGMHLIAYWTPAEGPEASNTLIYVLAFPSREARAASWKAFRDDPDWQKAYQASIAGGKLVERIESTVMKAVDYSPIQ